MAEKEKNNHNNIDTIGVLMAVLQSGNSVELPATGFSMFPTLRPGYRIVVKPLIREEIPLKGSIVVVFKDNDSLLMHRLIDVRITNNANPEFITRGDCCDEPDVPWHLNQIIGVAASVRIKEKEYLIKPAILDDLRYKYNRCLFWLYKLPYRLKTCLRTC